jgi:ubiquinone/menaquinone biosynthesis C-methylase UbiE
MRRKVTPELLDTDAGSPPEIAAALADLRRVNRWLGGVRTMSKLVEEVARSSQKNQLSLLDVGAGSGDVAAAVGERLAKRGIQIEPVLLDRSAEHLRAAEGMKCVVGDALSLPFAERSFDVVACSLFLHHLEPDEAVQFMNEALRVCRVAVLISDLRRNCLHLALTHLGKLFYSSRLTRHDAPASVRRAYTPAEIRELAGRASPAPQKIEQRNYWLLRSGTILYHAGAGA